MQLNLRASNEATQRFIEALHEMLNFENNGYPVSIPEQHEALEVYNSVIRLHSGAKRSPDTLAREVLNRLWRCLQEDEEKFDRVREFTPAIIQALAPTVEFERQTLLALHKAFKKFAEPATAMPVAKSLYEVSLTP